MTAPARRPWWRRKRWAAAVAVWLAVAYPLSLGPVAYGHGRRWIGDGTYRFAFAPTDPVVDYLVERDRRGLNRDAIHRTWASFVRYRNWWDRMAARHRVAAASD